MISEKVISISELKTHPSKYIKSLKQEGEKYIFIHNKPKAVIMDIQKYEMYERLKNIFLNNNIGFSSDENIINPINFWDGMKKNLFFDKNKFLLK